MVSRVFDSQQRFDLVDFLSSCSSDENKILESIYTLTGDKLHGVVITFGYETVIYFKLYTNLLPFVCIDADNRIHTVSNSSSKDAFNLLCDNILGSIVAYSIDNADESLDIKQDWEGRDYA